MEPEEDLQTLLKDPNGLDYAFKQLAGRDPDWSALGAAEESDKARIEGGQNWWNRHKDDVKMLLCQNGTIRKKVPLTVVQAIFGSRDGRIHSCEKFCIRRLERHGYAVRACGGCATRGVAGCERPMLDLWRRHARQVWSSCHSSLGSCRATELRSVVGKRNRLAPHVEEFVPARVSRDLSHRAGR